MANIQKIQQRITLVSDSNLPSVTVIINGKKFSSNYHDNKGKYSGLTDMMARLLLSEKYLYSKEAN